MEYFDTGCYVVALIFFLFAGLNVKVLVGNPEERIKFEWLAFGVLVLSLLF